jgi:hypothetical protein
MKTVEKVTVNFKMTPEEREEIKILAAKARLSQSEFLRRLIYNYGEELVELERPTGDKKIVYAEANQLSCGGMADSYTLDGDQVIARSWVNVNGRSGFVPGDYTIISCHSGDGDYQQLSIPFEEQE